MHQILLILLSSTCPAALAERQGFTVCYGTEHQRPLWTVHQFKATSTPSARKHWRKDHELDSLPSSAFTNSGFHRGHLAPAADLPESEDTFLTSNAIAQNPALNAGKWRALENRIRKTGPATILTGAIYAGCGNEQIEAPCFIYKIAIHENGALTAAFAANQLGQSFPLPHNAPLRAVH